LEDGKKGGILVIIIEVRFNQAGKKYQYLWINPNHYKIDKSKALIYEYGSTSGSPLIKAVWPAKSYKVDSLPKIVTSQITLLDNNNHIDIQNIGSASIIEKAPEPKQEEKCLGVSMSVESFTDMIMPLLQHYKK